MKDIDLEDGFLLGTETTGGFSDKYEAKEKLGAGVSSVVWRCIDKNTGEEFAVKIIDKLLDQGGIDIEGTTRDEIDVLQQLQEHSNIIGLVDVFESATFFFLVFELATRGELFDYLTEQVTLSEKKTRRIMYDVLHAVLFMHNKGIAHRDMKLENILLDGDLNIKISDFGFAVVLKEGELLRELCGTPGYLAPEVLQCSMFPDAPGYGKEVDMWACGVMMYTLLVGFPPFWHRRQIVMLRSIMEGKYQFHSPEWDDISPCAKDLISQLLVVDPHSRFTAADALAHSWFDSVQPARNQNYSARWKFKGAVLTVLAVREFQRLLQSKFQPVTFELILQEPYGVKPVRKLIDGCAFRIYGHWVKRNKDEQQNRAALFENKPHKEKYNNGVHSSVHSALQYEVSFRMASFGHFKPTRKSAITVGDHAKD